MTPTRRQPLTLLATAPLLRNMAFAQSVASDEAKIAIGPPPVPGGVESNWLPAPDGKPFSLAFRTYVSKEVVRRGEWQPANARPIS